MKAKPSWPKQVTIQATPKALRRRLPAGYDGEHEGYDAYYHALGDTMRSLVIESWADLALSPSEELADEDERINYNTYLRAQGKSPRPSVDDDEDDEISRSEDGEDEP